MSDEALIYGTIHPLTDALSFEEPIVINFADGGNVQVLVYAGRFQARISATIKPDVPMFIRTVTSMIQGAIDALGFLLGAASVVEVDGGLISPGIGVMPAHHSWPEVAGRKVGDSAWIEEGKLQPLVAASLAHPLIRYALADIRASIKQADDTAFYSYRAVESIRQLYQDRQPMTDDRSEGWNRLRDSLKIERAELEKLAGMAQQRRHGGAALISEDERLWAIRLARTVIERCVELV